MQPIVAHVANAAKTVKRDVMVDIYNLSPIKHGLPIMLSDEEVDAATTIRSASSDPQVARA